MKRETKFEILSLIIFFLFLSLGLLNHLLKEFMILFLNILILLLVTCAFALTYYFSPTNEEKWHTCEDKENGWFRCIECKGLNYVPYPVNIYNCDYCGATNEGM